MVGNSNGKQPAWLSASFKSTNGAIVLGDLYVSRTYHPKRGSKGRTGQTDYLIVSYGSLFSIKPSTTEQVITIPTPKTLYQTPSQCSLSSHSSSFAQVHQRIR